MNDSGLLRVITFPRLLLYGVGTMVGGGFYALTGKVAGEAGMATPLAFGVAGLLALVNAATFGELSARMPRSAGEAHYMAEAFGRRWLSRLVGWLVILTGVVSAATLSVATVGFAQDLFALPEQAGVAAVVLLLGAIAAWGIGESVTAVMVITVIEVAALIFVGVVAGDNLADLPSRLGEIAPVTSLGAWTGIATGAFLALYSFIGFEDMVNMAEEVVDVRRTLPRAIFWSVVITTGFYLVVSLVAVLTVAPDELAAAATPYALVVDHVGPWAATVMVIVSLLTGINGALVQIVMASRVAYGMAERDDAPSWLGRVHARTHTPLAATVAATSVILALALFFPLVTLAEFTSAAILVVFVLLNAALIRIKLRGDEAPEAVPDHPLILPILAGLGCLAALGVRALELLQNLA